MSTLKLPANLEDEFATVRALWDIGARTRRVDAFILAWVKFEKQTRKLMTFLIYQHPGWNQAEYEDANAVIARSRIFPEHCLAAVEEISGVTLPALLGASDHARLWREVLRIEGHRNKIFHGQLTGQARSATELSEDVCHLVAWIDALAVAATREFGYDGLRPKVELHAQQRTGRANHYDFATVEEFETWLKSLSRRRPRWI